MNTSCARTSHPLFAFSLFFVVMSHVCGLSAMSTELVKVSNNAFALDGLNDKDKVKVKNRLDVLSQHLSVHDHQNDQIVSNKTVGIPDLKTCTQGAKWAWDSAIWLGEGIIFTAQVIEATKTIVKTSWDGYVMACEYWNDNSKETFNKIKTIVENDFNKNGYYLNQGYLERFKMLILVNKIEVSSDLFQKLQRQCAINILRYPYYLQDDYEKICIDLNYDKDDYNDLDKIKKSKTYQAQPQNEDVIKNMNDVFLSALKRSKLSLTKKFMRIEINENDHILLANAIKEAQELNYSEPIVIYTSLAFNKKYSTNYKRQTDRMKQEKEFSKKENKSFSHNNNSAL